MIDSQNVIEGNKDEKIAESDINDRASPIVFPNSIDKPTLHLHQVKNVSNNKSNEMDILICDKAHDELELDLEKQNHFKTDKIPLNSESPLVFTKDDMV